MKSSPELRTEREKCSKFRTFTIIQERGLTEVFLIYTRGKPVFVVCVKNSCRPASASMQCDQHLCYSLPGEKIITQLV